MTVNKGLTLLIYGDLAWIIESGMKNEDRKIIWAEYGNLEEQGPSSYDGNLADIWAGKQTK